MSNSAEVKQSTYQYRKPFRFMDTEYTDSRNLAEAFIDNWNIALSVFRRGSMENFWEEYVQAEEGKASEISAASAFFHEAYEKMWEKQYEDAVFQAVLYYIEPALNAIPFLGAEMDRAYLMSFEEFGDWIYRDRDIYDTRDEHYNRRMAALRLREGTMRFDNKVYINAFYLHAAENQVFSTYLPQLREVEKRFIETEAADRSPVQRELGLRLGNPLGFYYHEGIIENMEEFASLMNAKEEDEEYFSFVYKLNEERKRNPGKLLWELFESQEYHDSFEKWVAKVDGGKFYEKSKELEKKWHELNELADEEGYKDKDSLFEEYQFVDEIKEPPICDKFLERCPAEAQEIKTFLKTEIKTADDYVALANESVNKAQRWHQAIEAVLTGIVEAGLMNKEDIVQNQPWKNYEAGMDKIKEEQEHLETLQLYVSRLKDALMYLEKNSLPQGWDGADREERVMLLVMGWYPMSDGKSDQKNALFDKVRESWKKGKDISLLVDAKEILFLRLKRRLSEVCLEDVSDMKSVFDDCSDCLKLYDRISELCEKEENNKELEENWDKMCKLIFDGTAKPILGQVFLEFEEKYRQDKEFVVSMVKKGECFGGISYGENNTVSIKFVEPDETKYSASVYEVIKEICRNASDYMSNYSQLVDSFSRELSVIREEGCHYGELSVDLKKWTDFILALNDAKETLGKNLAGIVSLIDDAYKRMIQIDDERARREEEERCKRKEKEEEEERVRHEKEQKKKRWGHIWKK